MAIARVQTKDSGALNAALTNTRTVTFTSAPTSGNLLVAVAACGDDSTGLAMASTGWTLGVDQQSDATTGTTHLRLALWYKIAGAGESSNVNVTTTNNGHLNLWIAEYSGVDTSSPLDVIRAQRCMYSTTGGEQMGWLAQSGNPSYRGGLHLMFAGLQHTDALSTYPAVSSFRLHGAAQVGSTTSHTNGADAARVSLRSFEEIVGSTDETPACGDEGYADKDMRATTIGVIFKASGATAAAARMSGAGTGTSNWRSTTGTLGSGTPNQLVKNDTAAAATSWTVAYPTTPVAGDLLFVGIRHGSVVEAINPPLGWAALPPSETTHTPKYFYKIAGAGESNSYQFTWATSQVIAGVAVEFYVPTGSDFITFSATPPLGSDSSGGRHVHLCYAVHTIASQHWTTQEWFPYAWNSGEDAPSGSDFLVIAAGMWSIADLGNDADLNDSSHADFSRPAGYFKNLAGGGRNVLRWATYGTSGAPPGWIAGEPGPAVGVVGPSFGTAIWFLFGVAATAGSTDAWAWAS